MEHARTLGVHDHLCWGYDDPAEFPARAAEFLVDGLAAGQRVLYVGGGDPDALIEQLRGVDALEEALAAGSAQVASLDARYPVGTVVQPVEQVRAYVELTELALEAGFTGFRVAADVTPLVRTSEQLDAFARYEHRIDREMVARPLAALCAYDRAELGADVIAQTACMHASTSTGTSPFRLHGTDRSGCAVAISGELDLVSAEWWPLALARAGLRPIAGELVVDATRLAYIDHRSLLELVRYAHGEDARLVLRGGPPSLPRLVDLLDLTTVRVEAVT